MRRSMIFALAAMTAVASAAYALPSDSGTATGASAKAADPRSHIVCRRFVRTGSLVDGYRICKTRGEWDREQENVRQFSVSDSCSTRGEPSHGPCNP
jgi:hypothetical protein